MGKKWKELFARKSFLPERISKLAKRQKFLLKKTKPSQNISRNPRSGKRKFAQKIREAKKEKRVVPNSSPQTPCLGGWVWTPSGVCPLSCVQGHLGDPGACCPARCYVQTRSVARSLAGPAFDLAGRAFGLSYGDSNSFWRSHLEFRKLRIGKKRPT